MSEIISRADALAAGLTRYFTGEPCLNQHVSERNVSSRCCRECERVRNATDDRLAKARERSARWKAEHKDDLKEIRAKYYAENKAKWQGYRATEKAATNK